MDQLMNNELDIKNNLNSIQTPGFVLVEKILKQKLEITDKIQNDTNCNILYALKPLVNKNVMQTMIGRVKGFSSSSLYEAKYAREIIGDKGTVHISTPGIIPNQIHELAEICDCIMLNSYTQYNNYINDLVGKTKLGLRINPQLSYSLDERFNPCRLNSKLGMPLSFLEMLIELSKTPKNLITGISGIQFHTNCDSTDYKNLLDVVDRVIIKLAKILPELEWINLGGGYLLENDINYEPLYEAIYNLQNIYNLKVYFEPGAGFVREAGYIVSTVIDKFIGDGGKTIAVLDTSINHMQETFEYQFYPDVLDSNINGKYEYLLAGSTCLAGDIFGCHSFNEPLEIGSKVVFEEIGAYSFVKSHMFNGINLPNVYWLSETHGCVLQKSFTYADYLSRI
jgi:carboxynorspermidine decarboxylase